MCFLLQSNFKIYGQFELSFTAHYYYDELFSSPFARLQTELCQWYPLTNQQPLNVVSTLVDTRKPISFALNESSRLCCYRTCFEIMPFNIERCSVQSKCAVLSKACDYITSLSDANESLAANESDIVATSEQLAEVRRQFSILQEENRLLWAELQQRGINAPTSIIHPPIVLDDWLETWMDCHRLTQGRVPVIWSLCHFCLPLIGGTRRLRGSLSRTLSTLWGLCDVVELERR